MAQMDRRLRTGMVVFAGLALLAGCGQNVPQETAQAVAPVRLVVDQLAKHPTWRDGAGRCLCVGHYREDGVEDFPPGLLDDMRARHAWVHNWSECAPYYGRKIKLAGCGGGTADYVCTVVARSNAERTARVLCHAAGENKVLQDGFLQDEYDVSEKDGAFTARAVGQRALAKLYE